MARSAGDVHVSTTTSLLMHCHGDRASPLARGTIVFARTTPLTSETGVRIFRQMAI